MERHATPVDDAIYHRSPRLVRTSCIFLLTFSLYTAPHCRWTTTLFCASKQVEHLKYACQRILHQSFPTQETVRTGLYRSQCVAACQHRVPTSSARRQRRHHGEVSGYFEPVSAKLIHSDVKAIKAPHEGLEEVDCDYIEFSTVPDQTGGAFWSILNRLFIGGFSIDPPVFD